MDPSENIFPHPKELNVSFEIQFSTTSSGSPTIAPDGFNISEGATIQNSCLKVSSSFSCLFGAALSANATLANTNMCNGRIREEILPSLDSPKSFRRLASSPSFSRLDFTSSSSHSSLATSGGSAPMDSDFMESEKILWRSMSSPIGTEFTS